MVTVLETFTAVSNMPVTHEEPAGAGLKRISFAPTPPMSSYLFVLAAGELERTTGDADGVEIGVVTTIGKRERGRYALDSAIALLRYYKASISNSPDRKKLKNPTLLYLHVSRRLISTRYS